MAFNGSGVFQRLYNWVNDAAASIKIRADRMDAEMDGFATGLSTCITKDGQTTITANLPMSTYRHTGVGAASSRTDYARFDQLQDGKTNWVAAGGTSDAITAAYSIPLTTLVDGQLCFVRAGAANTTTTPTFSPNGITARTIVKQGGSALAAGDIAGAGHELVLRYNLANTRWELLNPKSESILGLNNTFTGDNVFQGVVDVTNVNAETTSGIDLRTSGGTSCLHLGSGGSANLTLGGNMSGGGTHKLVSMADPSSAQDYTTKAYVDGLTYLKATSVTQSTGQSLANGWNVLAFDTEDYDDSGWHNNATNNSRITVDSDGRYNISGAYSTADSNNGIMGIAIAVNGTRKWSFRVSSGASVTDGKALSIAQFGVPLSSGDYVEIHAQHSSAPDTTIITETRFCVQKVR